MEEQISLIFEKKSNGVAALGLATEVNKLTLEEKIKIIEIITKKTPNSLPKAITIQAKKYKDYFKFT